MVIPDREAMKMLFSSEFWRMSIYWTVSLIYSYFLLLFSKPPLSFFFFPNTPSYPRRHLSATHSSQFTNKPICIVTGATSGLGAAAARALAAEGYHVVLAGRSSQLLCETIEEIKNQHRDACLNAFQVDLTSFRSIMKFQSSIKQWLLDSDLHPSVQLLVNNAGILAKSNRITADGYDQMMETNYIGAFILTNLLLPLLKKSPVPARIVNVTSFTHRCVSDVQVDKQSLSCLSPLGKYPFAHIYEYSKFCVLLFSYELHRQLYAKDPSLKVTVNSADPGAVETSIMRELPPCLSQLAFTVLRFLGLLSSPENGVASIIDAALAPPDVSGRYFFGGNGRTLKSSSLSYNLKLAEELWSTSHRLFQETLQALGGSMKD